MTPNPSPSGHPDMFQQLGSITRQLHDALKELGYDGAMLAINIGANTDTNATFAVLIEDSDNNSSWAAVADEYLNGTEALAGFQFDDDNELRKIGYSGIKRYLRATITPSGNDSGNIFVSAEWVLKALRQPTANPPA